MTLRPLALLSFLPAVLLHAAGASSPETSKTRASPAPAAGAAAAPAATGWQRLEPGLELGVFEAPRRAGSGDSLIRALRIDPSRFALRLLNASAPDEGELLTAREWSARHDLVAAINASMYQSDFLTSVSLMTKRGHVNNPRLSRDRAILAFDPRVAGLPPVKLIDRDCDDFAALREQYGTLVQSIRMVSCDRRNVWSPQERRFSTAAVGLDTRGRVLFLHVRSPYPTHQLIDMLLHLPLRLSGAMYVEGGRQAQLYVRGGGREFEFTGRANPSNGEEAREAGWPIPNVLGVVRRDRGAKGEGAAGARGTEREGAP